MEILISLFTNVKFHTIVIILSFFSPQFGMPESAVVVEKLCMNGSRFLVSNYSIRALTQVCHFSMRTVLLMVPGNNLKFSFFIHTSSIALILHFSGLIYTSDSRNLPTQKKSQPAFPCSRERAGIISHQHTAVAGNISRNMRRLWDLLTV